MKSGGERVSRVDKFSDLELMCHISSVFLLSRSQPGLACMLVWLLLTVQGAHVQKIASKQKIYPFCVHFFYSEENLKYPVANFSSLSIAGIVYMPTSNHMAAGRQFSMVVSCFCTYLQAEVLSVLCSGPSFEESLHNEKALKDRNSVFLWSRE